VIAKGLYKRTILPALLAAEVQFRQTATDAFVLFTVVVQPIIVAVLALWMLRDKGADNAIFIIVGSGMTGLWSALLFMGGNSITQERWTGTLESVVGAPVSMHTIVFGKNLASVGQSLISMLVSYALAALFFGYPIHVARVDLFAISLALTVIAFIAFGMILSPLFLLNPQVQDFQNGMEFPVYILSGFLFPIALLPGWATPLSYILPTYWAAQAAHLSAEGGAVEQIYFAWGMLALLAVIHLAISGWLFRLVLRRARVDATLGLE
jgi:ABC-2 type transport system permease protein